MFESYKPRVGLAIALMLTSIGAGVVFFVLLFVYSPVVVSPVWRALIICIPSLFFGLFGVKIVYGMAYKARTKYFDQTFLPLGLQGKKYLFTSRQYHGQVGKYGVHIYLQPTQRQYSIPVPGTSSDLSLTYYVGERLEILLDCPLQTRMAISNKEFKVATPIDVITYKPFFNVARRAAMHLTKSQTQEVKVVDPDLKDFAVYATEPTWAEKIITKPAIKTLFLSLLGVKNYVGIKSLMILPASIKYHLIVPMDSINPDKISGMLKELVAFADSASQISAPQVLEKESENEKLSRVDRSFLQKKQWPYVLGILFVLLGLPIIFTAIFFWFFIK